MTKKGITLDNLVMIGYAGVVVAYAVLFYAKYKSHQKGA
jgi:hypothetical protein